jgi:hypothetical protein
MELSEPTASGSMNTLLAHQRRRSLLASCEAHRCYDQSLDTNIETWQGSLAIDRFTHQKPHVIVQHTEKAQKYPVHSLHGVREWVPHFSGTG